MMVNEVKNNLVPWQSTVPQQMPWMSSYEPTSMALQFGQPGAVNPMGVIVPNNVMNPISQPPLMEQHPSLASFPTATTLTSPITACPTSMATNTALTPGGASVSTGCFTTTTQSCPAIQNIMPNTCNLPQELNNYIQNSFASAPHTSINPYNSLTHIPTLACLSNDKIQHHKRPSIEMDDEQIMAEEPPAKQLLSERKLFEQFGSLHLDGNIERGVSLVDSDDSDEDERSQFNAGTKSQGREEFNRYVYLLFKDKKGDGGSVAFAASNSTLDRIVRDERDKLSKAVVLWNPPLKDRYYGSEYDGDDDDDEEELKYSDHKDFLKKPAKPNDSIVITDVTSDIDEPCNNITMNVTTAESIDPDDDIMIE